jgi:hypothetical protein
MQILCKYLKFKIKRNKKGAQIFASPIAQIYLATALVSTTFFYSKGSPIQSKHLRLGSIQFNTIQYNNEILILIFQ